MQEFICLDIETTGLDKKQDNIIEIAAVKFTANQDNLAEFKTFIFYPDPIPEIVEHLTGINQTMLIGAPNLENIKQELLNFCGDLPIVGHNISFDLGFLHKFDIPVPGTPIDTIHLSQTFLEAQSYSLETLCRNFNHKYQPSHRALDDVLANIELFQFFLKQIQNLNPEQTYLWDQILSKATNPYHKILQGFLPKDKTQPQLFTPDFSNQTTTETQKSKTSEIMISSEKILKNITPASNQELFVLSQASLNKLSNHPKLPPYQSLVSSNNFLTYLKDSSNLNHEETNLLLKIATKIIKAKSLYSNELNLFKQDFSYISHFLDDQYQIPEQKDPYLSDHYTFFKLLLNHELPKFKKVHFEEHPFLEETFIRSQQTDLTLDLSDQGKDIPDLSFAFAHLSKFAQTIQAELDYPKDSFILNALDLSTTEFAEFLQSLKKHSPNPHAVNAAQKLKHQSSKYLVWIYLNHDKEASVHFVEKNIHLKLTPTLETTPCDELFKYPSKNSESEFTINIQTQLPEPNHENHLELLSDLLFENLSQIKSQGLIIATSKNQITQLHKILANKLDAQGISLLSQYVSGSKGKILDNIANNESPHILMCTHHFLLRNHPPLPNLEKAYLTKIPMGLPFHPYYNWLKKETDNDFFNLTLPYTASIIYQICQNLQSQNSNINSLDFCDTRLTSLSWTKTILKNLPQNIIVK